MRRRITGLVVLMALALAGTDAAPATESAAVTGVVDAFHDALRSGDQKAAMELLAADAIVLESGYAETRAEYERHHLKEDIAFAQAVPSTRSVLSVQLEGDAAWVISTTQTKGSFRGREINSTGAELIVLSKSPQGWRIRAIHWSSHEAKGNK